MHESGLCRAIVEGTLELARGSKVRSVSVKVGALRHATSPSMELHWEVQTKGSPLEGSTLVVHEVDATGECRDCGSTSAIEPPLILCTHCGSSAVDIRTGEELVIESIEVEDASPQDG